ncbi:Leucine Rich Repeat [Seminavis robusta]|uniref:Leucine Rich Repeat n=1 Tax=Seminavis robusta TaxID=568900 RepID=A0A9N8EU88_9STRA|nr:Leucine Rich Repeat [Seminavis robusta]|eukprot:Sro2192_g318400.1 Leucine Rich Repeat (592) ;mRNA; f:674-2539
MNKKDDETQFSIQPKSEDVPPVPRSPNASQTPEEVAQAKSTGSPGTDNDGSDEPLMKIVAQRSRFHRLAINHANRRRLASGSEASMGERALKGATKDPSSGAPLPAMLPSTEIPVSKEQAMDVALVESMQAAHSFDNAEGMPGAHAINGPGPTEGLEDRDASEPTDERSSGTVLESDDEIAIDGAVVVDQTDLESGSCNDGSRDGAEDEVIQGRILPDRHKKQCGSQLIVCALVLVLACGLFASLFGATRPPASANDSPSHEERQVRHNATKVVYPPFQDGLSMEILKGVQDTGSAYYKANAWMNQDPQLDRYSKDRQYQRFTMAWLFYITSGHNWTRNDNWLSYTVSECDWFSKNSSLSVHGWHEGEKPEPVCDEEGNLAVLNVSSNNLKGLFPRTSSIGFKAIRIVDVSNNAIHGAIPNTGSYSYSLEVLAVSNNKFQAQLTGGGGFAAFNLRVARMDGNKLMGWHSAVYPFLPHLEVLDIADNLFEGELSPKLRLCKNMTYFANRGNSFHGSLPTELGELSLLQELDVSGNRFLHGTVPSELALLPDLARLNIIGTSITGTIPELLCSKVNRGDLVLIANKSIAETCQ